MKCTIYISYPNARISIHLDPNCGHVTKGPANPIRERTLLKPLDALRLLDDLRQKEIPFTSTQGQNGYWVTVEELTEADAMYLAKQIKAALESAYNIADGFSPS
jgi:hypothetical protein